MVGSLVDIYFGEIKDTRNFSFLGAAIGLGIIADILIMLSKYDIIAVPDPRIISLP